MNKVTKKLLGGVAKISEGIIPENGVAEDFDLSWLWVYMPPKPDSLKAKSVDTDQSESELA